MAKGARRQGEQDAQVQGARVHPLLALRAAIFFFFMYISPSLSSLLLSYARRGAGGYWLQFADMVVYEGESLVLAEAAISADHFTRDVVWVLRRCRMKTPSGSNANTAAPSSASPPTTA